MSKNIVLVDGLFEDYHLQILLYISILVITNYVTILYYENNLKKKIIINKTRFNITFIKTVTDH